MINASKPFSALGTGELLPRSCHGCRPMADQSQVTPAAGKWAFASNKPACLEDPSRANAAARSTSPISQSQGSDAGEQAPGVLGRTCRWTHSMTRGTSGAWQEAKPAGARDWPAQRGQAPSTALPLV